MRKLAMCLAVSALFGCEKTGQTGPTPSEPGEPPPPPMKVAEPVKPPAPAPPAMDAKALLTDEKVAGYLVYQKDLLTVMADAVGMGISARAKAGGDKKEMEKEISRDERNKKIAEVSQAALVKSGLTQPEVQVLSSVLSSWSAKRMLVADAKAALEKDKAKPKGGGIMAQIHEKQIAEAEKDRADFEAKYGKDALAAVDKHDAELVELTRATLDAVLKKK